MKKIVWLSLIGLVFMACNRSLKEGESFLSVREGKIWYQVIGKGQQTPILMLHGGPGFPSYYLTPLFELGNERPVIVYDQLGCGRSSALEDTSRMTIQAQVADLEALISHLQLKEFYLFAHSYGTMLAMEYYFTDKSKIKGMILASPCLSVKKWEQDGDTLISRLDTAYQRVLNASKQGIITDSALFNQAFDTYFANYYNKTMNAYLDSSMKYAGNKLYAHMWGQYDYYPTGLLKDYDRTADLHKVNTPTLLTCGEFDAARPSTVQYYQRLMPQAQFVLIRNAAHSTMNDQPAENVRVIRTFLSSLDQNK
jgi:proline iminopeptidase